MVFFGSSKILEMMIAACCWRQLTVVAALEESFWTKVSFVEADWQRSFEC